MGWAKSDKILPRTGFSLRYNYSVLNFCRVSRWIIVLISFIWLASLTLNLPMEFNGGLGHYGVNSVWGGCVPTLISPGQFDYRTVQIYLGSYVPLALTGILYTLILLKAWFKPHRGPVTPAESSANAARETRTYRRKMNMSYLLFFSFLAYCVFFLCYPVIARSFPMISSQYPMLPVVCRGSWVV